MQNNTPKILILILSTKDKRYNQFITASRNTWIKQATNNSIQCFFYQGGANEDYLEKDTIYLKANDSLKDTGAKLIKAFQFIEHQEIEYDYVLRTNLSSYIYLENLLKVIQQNQCDNLYAGHIGTFTTILYSANKFDITRKICTKIFKKYTLRFASGSGILLSHSNVKKILNDKKLKLDLIDDVMIGECLSRQGVKIKNISRIELNNNEITFSKNIKSPDQIKECYHIRLKSVNRSIDVGRFYALDKYAYYPFDVLDPNLL